jgi:hypothetical protein
MWLSLRTEMLGAATVVGGVLGVVLAPIMVAIKYLTGWAVIPEPFWIALASPMLGPILAFGSPARLWVVYGSLYSIALLLMLAGLFALITLMRSRCPGQRPWGLWLLAGGLTLVLGGDATHTLTWHQHGLTIPTPGTNPIANTGYAIHMMGMNVMLVGSLMTGISALRKQWLPRSLAWLFALVAPGAVLISLSLLPTSPSGGLWMFSATMIVVGAMLRRGQAPRLAAA